MRAKALDLEATTSKCPTCTGTLFQGECTVLGYNPVRHHSQTFLYVKCLDCGYFMPVKEKATPSRAVPDEMDWEARYELLAEAAGLAPGRKRPRQKALKERDRAKKLMKGRKKRVADH